MWCSGRRGSRKESDFHFCRPSPPNLCPLAHDCCTQLDPFALFCNPPYTDEDWVRHSGWRRLLPRSHLSILRVVAWFWPPLLVEAALCAAVVGYQAAAVHHPHWPSLANGDLITPLSLTAFVLGLLLVFRTNTSYDRWWEARKIWGGLAGDTRTLARRAVTWSTRGATGGERNPLPPAATDALRWTAAAPVALAMRVAATPAERDAWAAGLVDVLLPDDVLAVAASSNPPGVVAVRLGAALAAIPGLCGPLLAALDSTVDSYSARAVAADKLRTQPIPSAYTRNTTRFLIVWLAFLPIAVFEKFKWATPVPVLIVSFFLLAIENMATCLEQPHSVLPLDVLVAAAVASVTEQPEWRSGARPPPAPMAMMPPKNGMVR